MNKDRSIFQISILNFYLFTEAITNFGICVLVFTLTAFMSQVFTLTELVINRGLGLRDTVTFIVYFLPSLLFLVMPLSLLMGILITFGRMSSDGEIIAFKTSGIGLRSLLRPILVVAFIAFGATTFLTVYLSPHASQALKRHVYDIARTKAELGLKARVFNTDFNDLMIFVNEIIPETHRLRGVLISDAHRADEPATIIAREGYFVSDPKELELTLHLKDGSIHSLNRKLNAYQKVDFAAYHLNLALEHADTGQEKKKRKQEMLTQELLDNAAKLQSEGEHYPLLVEFHSRFAIPFACIVFGFLGVPLGVYSPRTGRAYGFVVGLIVILLYYILFSFGRNLGGTGVLSPAVSIWLPNLLFLLLAIYLFRKGETESAIPLLEYLARLTEIVRRKVIFLVEGSRAIDPAAVVLLEDLNKDGEQALALKFGIERSLAQNIIAYRDRQGSIKDLNDLRNVPGIDDTTFESIRENTAG